MPAGIRSFDGNRLVIIRFAQQFVRITKRTGLAVPRHFSASLLWCGRRKPRITTLSVEPLRTKRRNNGAIGGLEFEEINQSLEAVNFVEILGKDDADDESTDSELSSTAP